MVQYSRYICCFLKNWFFVNHYFFPSSAALYLCSSVMLLLIIARNGVSDLNFSCNILPNITSFCFSGIRSEIWNPIMGGRRFLVQTFTWWASLFSNKLFAFRWCYLGKFLQFFFPNLADSFYHMGVVAWSRMLYSHFAFSFPSISMRCCAHRAMFVFFSFKIFNFHP